MTVNPVDDFVRMLLERHAGPHTRVLDVGCGPAPYKKWIKGTYIGLDITDAPYGPGIPRRVDIVGSAMALPLMSSSVDLVFSKSALYQVLDPDGALREFRRVLRDGGRLLLVDYNRGAQRRIQIAERAVRPCWTQWELRSHLKLAEFKQCELIVPTSKRVGAFEGGVRLLYQELFGTWAIVTGVK